jgi:endonuclease YncB( thermonuclease family)
LHGWLIGFLLALVSTCAQAIELKGSVQKVVDGDTFWLCDERACHKIRICGINAPEAGQPGYRESGAALSALARGRAVRCVQVGHGTPCDGRSKPTNRDRIVAQCFTGGADIAVPMIESGFACSWEKFSGPHYKGKGAVCP